MTMSNGEVIGKPPRRPPLRLPAQVPPVARDRWDPSAHGSGDGVLAAQSQCSHLRGLARQMCYSTLYGVSI
jgi:hypothetical protein